jgi:diadenosine tetraphosphatase ApaH/serine/threonine PP2A family protein phosphatase
MRTALLADIHANLPALEACLAHAAEQRAERYVFLGDLVGYGPDPGPVVDLIGGIAGAVVIRGNHDQAIGVEPKTRELNDLAYAALVWTRQALSAAQRSYLASLPLVVREEAVCFVHASADRPERFEYVGDPRAAARSLDAALRPYTFSGHVHDPTLYFTTPAGKTAEFRPTAGSPVPTPHRRRWLAIVGSVGQPRDGNPRAAYALFDAATETLTFYRVAYDHLATARRIRAVGLPAMFAERLEHGA